jgi:hypothetical protein
MTALAKLATVATMGCALGLSACFVEHVDAPAAPAQPPPPVVEPTPTVPAVQLPAGVVNGKPGHYKDGGPQAYWIWRDEVGRYHFRVTAPAGQKTDSFRGRASATVGHLANLKVVHPEHRANINANQAGMVFDFYPKGQNDGFDFDVSDPKSCVRFDLNTWGNKHKIVIGTTEQSPTSEHFIVCP